MNVHTALQLAKNGERVTRRSWDNDYLVIKDGRLLRGQFLGETSLAALRPCSLSEEDRSAEDWQLFSRILPDPWEGCDMPVSRNNHTHR